MNYIPILTHLVFEKPDRVNQTIEEESVSSNVFC